MSSNKTFTIALAGLLSALWLPSTAHAQSVTPESALLNRSAAIAPGGSPTLTQPAVIDGERALLNRHQTITLTPAKSVIADAPSVDGVKALLNRSSS